MALGLLGKASPSMCKRACCKSGVSLCGTLEQTDTGCLSLNACACFVQCRSSRNVNQLGQNYSDGRKLAYLVQLRRYHDWAACFVTNGIIQGYS
jgi:hypothetical protein